MSDTINASLTILAPTHGDDEGDDMGSGRRKRGDKALSTIVRTLDSIYKTDPIIPAAMLAALKALDTPPAFVVAAASSTMHLHP